MVIFTGKNQPFVTNRNIGKTLSCQQLFDRLSKSGQRVKYLDLKQKLNLNASPTAGIDIGKFLYEAVEALPDCDVYIFDEIHHAFPRDPKAQGIDSTKRPIYRGDKYNQAMTRFWQKVSELQAKGKKFVFVTALHPQDAAYQQFLSNPQIDEFFNAPVVELG